MVGRYCPGDLVRLEQSPGADAAVWTVVEEDTNRTPVRDAQPAYLIECGRRRRYVYEADLRSASGTLGAT